MPRHPHASYGKVNSNITDSLSAPTESIYKQKSAAHSPVEGRLGYEAKDGNLNRSRPQDSKTRCTEKKSEMLTSARV